MENTFTEQLRNSFTAPSISLIALDTMIILPIVPGNNSWLRDNLNRALDCE